MAPMYYRGAHAAILVFDITSPESLDKVAEWVEELRQHVGKSISCVVMSSVSVSCHVASAIYTEIVSPCL
jgi:Ras-related protein Rab-21